MSQRLAERIRAKYPNEYDDLDDDTLEQLVLKKYPEYEDMIPKKEPKKDTSFSESVSEGSKKATGIGPHKRTWGDTFSDFKSDPWGTVTRPVTTVTSRNINKIAEPLMKGAENTPGQIRNDKSTRPEDLIQRSGRAYLPDDLRTGALMQAYGEGVDALSNPLNIGFMGTGAIRNAAGAIIPRATTQLADKLRGIQQTADIGMKAASIPVATHGAQQVYEGETLPDKLLGGLQIGMGALGLRNRPLTQGGVEGYTKPGPVGPKYAGRGSTSATRGRLTAEGEMGTPAKETPPPVSNKPITKTYQNASGGETKITAPARNITTAEQSAGIKPFAPDFFDRMDPNFLGGMGDAELAGSTPYKPAPEPQLQNVANQIGSKVGNRVTVKDPLKVQQFIDMGFNPLTITERGTVMVRDAGLPTAEYAFEWPELGGPQYHIRGGEYDKSTVSRQRLEQLGIPVPPSPQDDRGEFVMPPEFGQDIQQIDESVLGGTSPEFTSIDTGEILQTPTSPYSGEVGQPTRFGDVGDIDEEALQRFKNSIESLRGRSTEPISEPVQQGTLGKVGQSIQNFMKDESGEFRLIPFPEKFQSVSDLIKQVKNNSSDKAVVEKLLTTAKNETNRENLLRNLNELDNAVREIAPFGKRIEDMALSDAIGNAREITRQRLDEVDGYDPNTGGFNLQPGQTMIDAIYDAAGEEPPTPKFKPGQLVKSKSTGEMGRIMPNKGISTMTHKELDEYRLELTHGTGKVPGDDELLDQIDNEFRRRGMRPFLSERGFDSHRKVLNFENDPNTEPISEMRVPGSAKPMFRQESDGTMQQEGMGLDNIALGGADPRVLDILGTALYKSARVNTAIKELLQNSIDEREISGKTDKPIRVVINRSSATNPLGKKSDSITVKDFGRGLNAEELYTVFSDVGKSGKADIDTAKGGFGFAKASPFLGSDVLEVTSITQEGRERVKYEFMGTPKQFKDQTKGVPLRRVVVGDTVPTGLTVRMYFPDTTSMAGVKDLIKELVENSPEVKNVEAAVIYANHREQEFLEDGMNASGIDKDSKFTFSGKPIPAKKDDLETDGANVDIHYELDDKERGNGKIVVLNNGLFVLSDSISYVFQGTLPHVPEKIVVNIKSKVKEGEEGYPFAANREAVNEDLMRKIKYWINDNITKKGRQLYEKELQRLFDNMITGPNFFMVDSGGKYTSEELQRFLSSDFARDLASVQNRILATLNDLSLEGVLGPTVKSGFIITKPEMGGINIQNPKGQSEGFAILINPFSAILKEGKDIKNMAQRYLHVVVHEYNHNRARSEGADYTWKLSEIYSAFDLEKQLAARDAITEVLRNHGGKIQELLRDYTDSRGRAATTEDILSRERESQWIEQPRQRGVSGGNKSDGKGAVRFFLRNPTPEKVKKAIEAGFEFTNKIREDGAWEFKKAKVKRKAPLLESEVPSTPEKVEPVESEVGLLRKNWDLTRGMMSIDPPFVTSAAFRQALPWVGTKVWMEAWWKAARAYGSQKYFDKMQEDIKQSPLFRQRGGEQRKRKSFADEVGLRMLDVSNTREARLEGIKSNLAERIPLYGRYIVKTSNRAFTAFLNHIRASEFENFIQLSKLDAEVQGNPELDYTKNLPAAKQLAEFLNVSTGAATLKAGVTNIKEYSLEHSAQKLADWLFSPRLIFSRMKMLNPSTYVFGDSRVRKLYLKAMLRAIAAWWGIAELLKLYYGDEVEVGTDPQNPDFGKVKVRDTRFDPGGGFLQYLVLGARIRPAVMALSSLEDTETGILPVDMGANWLSAEGGHYASSISGTRRQLGRGFNPPTETSTTLNFMSQKLHPAAKLLWDIGSTNERTPVFLLDRLMGMALPMYSQDLAELLVDDPELIPMSMFFGAVGGGSQTYDGTPIKPQFTPLLGLEEYDIQIGGKK